VVAGSADSAGEVIGTGVTVGRTILTAAIIEEVTRVATVIVTIVGTGAGITAS
jgi:hypothetical protein